MSKIDKVIYDYLKNYKGSEITQKRVMTDYNRDNPLDLITPSYCAVMFKTLCDRNTLKKLDRGVYRLHTDPINTTTPADTKRLRILSLLPTESPGITTSEILRNYFNMWGEISEGYIRLTLSNYTKSGDVKRIFRGHFIKSPIGAPPSAPSTQPAPPSEPPARPVIPAAPKIASVPAGTPAPLPKKLI